MLEGRARGWPLGFSLELFVVVGIFGRRGGNNEGGDSDVLVIEPPMALILVGGDVNDTMSRPAVGTGRGSWSLPILHSFVMLWRGHGKGPPLTEANLMPPGRHLLFVQEGLLLP